MIKKKAIFSVILVACLSLSLISCSSSFNKMKSTTKSNNNSTENNSSTEKEDTNENKEKEDSSNSDETKKENSVSKIKGKSTYIEKLDNLQKDLDEMPEKKDSDAGITNAMKSFYGVSYERYDEALNEIYNLLKEGLSEDVMEDLSSKQIEWIKFKEENAKKEEAKYEGGSFEFVASYTSLYESTKTRCYELVNEYMED